MKELEACLHIREVDVVCEVRKPWDKGVVVDVGHSSESDTIPTHRGVGYDYHSRPSTGFCHVTVDKFLVDEPIFRAEAAVNRRVDEPVLKFYVFPDSDGVMNCRHIPGSLLDDAPGDLAHPASFRWNEQPREDTYTSTTFLSSLAP